MSKETHKLMNRVIFLTCLPVLATCLDIEDFYGEQQSNVVQIQDPVSWNANEQSAKQANVKPMDPSEHKLGVGTYNGVEPLKAQVLSEPLKAQVPLENSAEHKLGSDFDDSDDSASRRLLTTSQPTYFMGADTCDGLGTALTYEQCNTWFDDNNGISLTIQGGSSYQVEASSNHQSAANAAYSHGCSVILLSGKLHMYYDADETDTSPGSFHIIEGMICMTAPPTNAPTGAPTSVPTDAPTTALEAAGYALSVAGGDCVSEGMHTLSLEECASFNCHTLDGGLTEQANCPLVQNDYGNLKFLGISNQYQGNVGVGCAFKPSSLEMPYNYVPRAGNTAHDDVRLICRVSPPTEAQQQMTYVAGAGQTCVDANMMNLDSAKCDTAIVGWGQSDLALVELDQDNQAPFCSWSTESPVASPSSPRYTIFNADGTGTGHWDPLRWTSLCTISLGPTQSPTDEPTSEPSTAAPTPPPTFGPDLVLVHTSAVNDGSHRSCASAGYIDLTREQCANVQLDVVNDFGLAVGTEQMNLGVVKEKFANIGCIATDNHDQVPGKVAIGFNLYEAGTAQVLGNQKLICSQASEFYSSDIIAVSYRWRPLPEDALVNYPTSCTHFGLTPLSSSECQAFANQYSYGYSPETSIRLDYATGCSGDIPWNKIEYYPEHENTGISLGFPRTLVGLCKAPGGTLAPTAAPTQLVSESEIFFVPLTSGEAFTEGCPVGSQSLTLVQCKAWHERHQGALYAPVGYAISDFQVLTLSSFPPGCQIYSDDNVWFNAKMYDPNWVPSFTIHSHTEGVLCHQTGTAAPTGTPTTYAPTDAPTTASPTNAPTASPSVSPTKAPTGAPTREPTTPVPTRAPTESPTDAPTDPIEHSITFDLVLNGVGFADESSLAQALVDTLSTTEETLTPDMISFEIDTSRRSNPQTFTVLANSITYIVTISSAQQSIITVAQQSVTVAQANPQSLLQALQTQGIAVTSVQPGAPVTSQTTLAPTDSPTDAPTQYPTASPTAAGPVPVATCGDGVLGSLQSLHNGFCPGLSSQLAATAFVAEACDVSATASFGTFVSGSGCGTLGDCTLRVGHTMQHAEEVVDLTKRQKQLTWGFTTDAMSNHAFDPHVASTGSASKLNPCLYSSQLLDTAGNALTLGDNRADGVACVIDAAKMTKYTSINYCYNSNLPAAPAAIGDLDDFGSRLDNSNAFYRLYGHKCQYPTSIKVTSPVGGAMSWVPETRDVSTNKILSNPAGADTYESMYDVCFELNDPSWPAVHPSSNEFVAQLTRVQYEVICDPEDQIEAYPDDGNDCEDNAAYQTDPTSSSFKCSRLGNRKNPCSDVHKLWELYSCDSTSCESLEGLKSESVSQYGTTNDKGVKYTFEHDAAPEKNKFQCSTKQFDNVELKSNDMMFGDAVEAQNKYICGTGGQSTPCAADMGEIVHTMNTCSSGIYYKDNTALKKRLDPLGKWRDLSVLSSQGASSYTPAQCDAILEANTDATAVAECAEYQTFRDLQQYPVGCGRKLKIRVAKGVSGQLALKVLVKSYNTAVHDGDADTGYTYWSSSMVPVSIEAKVKELTSVHNIGRDSAALTYVDEKGDVSFLMNSQSPFDAMDTVPHATMEESLRIDNFARSTRSHLEFIDCTESQETFAVERDQSIARFRVHNDGTDPFDGNYKYYQQYHGDSPNALRDRIYEVSTMNSDLGPTVAQLKTLQPKLYLRAFDDFNTAPAWWQQYSSYASPTDVDSWHEGYATNTGICLKTRLHVYEPSSCHVSSIDSPEYYINANPVNSDVSVSIASMQQVLSYTEDATVPLMLSVNHHTTNGDSRMWYFSHIEIEDMVGSSNAEDEQNGSGFDLYSYGNTVGATTGSSDTVANRAGITKVGAHLWRSFANKCTRRIYEAGSTHPGGFSAMDSAFTSPDFADAEACLDDARRQGQAIWGGDATGGKTGVFMRPSRKMTKNTQLKVKVFMYDGDFTGWHSGDAINLVQTDEVTVNLVHVPSVTRYDQYEIQQSTMNMQEGGLEPIPFSNAMPSGLGLPLSYRTGAHVCTYTTKGADGTVAGVDEYDVSVADHDMDCDATLTTVDANNKIFGSCEALTTHEVECLPSGADNSRAKLETVILYDESEGSHLAGQTYNDGSAAWTDGPMAMPENLVYQPAGQNDYAHDNKQWYRLEACSGTSGAKVDQIHWCDDTTADGYMGATTTLTAGVCETRWRGQTADPASGPGTSVEELVNSLSVDASGAIDTDQTNKGKAQNYWIVYRTNNDDDLPSNAICIQALSGFNTEDGSWTGAMASPINLRLIAVMKDSVSDGASTWTARSKSNAEQGAFSVNVASVRQVATTTLLDHSWKRTDTAHVSFIEERNDQTRAAFDSLGHTWGDVATDQGLTLATNIDCGMGNASDIFCADKIQWQENTNFHDQHLGRVEIKGYVKQMCSGTGSWLPAGGLFDVYTQYIDDYPNFGDTSPGHGILLNDGAGFEVSSASDIVSQEFDMLSTGTQISGNVPGQSICQIMLDGQTVADASANATVSSIRDTSCHIRDALDVVGHNTYTWSDTILARVVANKCHKVAGSGPLSCDAPMPPLLAREIASNLRFRLPHKWSNCLQFKFEVTVSNDDRVKPSYTFEKTVNGVTTDYRSAKATVYVAPQKRAEEPVAWINTDLSLDSACIGETTGACTSAEQGVKTIGDIEGTYVPIDANTNVDSTGAMSQVTIIAGYRTQLRVRAASASTDVYGEQNQLPSPLDDGGLDYKWDSLRETLQASNEHVHLTVESKYNDMVPTESNQKFCLWMCPESTPAGSGCAKNELIRVQGLPDDETAAVPNFADTIFANRDVNCASCTGDATSTPPCHQVGIAADGTEIKCYDPYARDPLLVGCPSYSDATPFHNPSSRYSIKCSKGGTCPELHNLYIQYPSDQVDDDVLEFSAWSRADYRGSAGFQRSRLSMNVLMQPAISISEVGFAVEQDMDCDSDSATGTDCPTGSFGAPMQPAQLIQIVPAANPPIALSLYENKLHGDPTACSALAATSNLAAGGSLADVTTHCGLRIPVNFAADDLMLVAPIGVKLELRQSTNFPTRQIAQSLRMLCSNYAQEATGVSIVDCVGSLVSIDASSAGAQDAELLRFQDKNAAVQPGNSRVLAAADYVSSSAAANQLSWNVGEQMSDKEFVFYGSDDTPHSLNEYSLNNKQCESSKFMRFDLVHRIGYNPATVAEVRSSMSLEVLDDDFYGKVQLAGLVNGNQLVPLAGSGGTVPPNTHTMPKTTWNGDIIDVPFSVYVMRSRTSFESDTPERRAIGMQAARAWIKVDLGGLSVNEFNVSIARIHGRSDETISSFVLSAATMVAGDGVTPNMIPIDFPSVSSGTECKTCDDVNGNCFYYNCDYTEGDSAADVPFQFFRISFQALGPASSCNEGGDKVLKFNVEKVVYTSEAGTDLKDSEITCGLDVDRNPLSTAEKAREFTETLTVLPPDPQLKAPFRISFAGFAPDIEATKASPLAWDAGLDGSFVPITETEHTSCATSNGVYQCDDRQFKLHVCSTLREDEGSVPWATWSQSTFRFFTQLQDSTNPWSKINNLYDISCPTDAEISRISSGASGASLTCDVMSTLSRTDAATATTEAIYCYDDVNDEPANYFASPAERETYCGNTVPRRLMWTVATDQDGARNAFTCPDSTSQNTAATWQKLPYMIFKTKDDGNVINLSRKPSLCIQNDKLPMSLQSGANTDTCTSIDTLSCVSLRVQDDETFAQDNTYLDRDVSVIEAHFGAPVWNSADGRLEIDVANRYYSGNQEKTLVSVALGGCQPELPTQSLLEFWNRHDGSAHNPVHGSGAGDATAFGDCDFLDSSNFDTALDNAQMFDSLFGATSLQPTEAEYTALGNDIFGFDETNVTASGTNTLFTKPREFATPAAKWTYTATTIESRGNNDLGTQAFSAKFSTSIEKLKSCKDRQGNSVVSTTLDSQGNTVYSFHMSTTHLTATRKDDTSFVKYSPLCTDTQYSLIVSNDVYALSGLSTNTPQDAIYVQSMDYEDCPSLSNCDATIGPEHKCPTTSEFAGQEQYLKKMEYVVNLDLRSVPNQISGNAFQSYFGLADVAHVQVDAANCYASAASSVEPLSAQALYTEAGVTRTAITFQTGCAFLRPWDGVAYTAPIADAFATCSADLGKSTDFNFRVRLWECTNENDLAAPETSTTCQLLPDWLEVSIAIAFVKSPTDITYEVEFEKLMRFYKNHDHRRLEAVNGQPPTFAQLDAWRTQNTLQITAMDPYVNYPINSMLTASLGFQEGSALEQTMTTSIGQVRLCRLKEFCHLPGISTNVVGAPQCSWQNLMLDATHSPYANWARNVAGCSEDSTCTVTPAQTTTDVPKLSCERLKWEEFVVAEGLEYMSVQAKKTLLLNGIVDSTGRTLSVGSIAVALDPTIEDMLMIDHGATTPIAESVHGNCEKNNEVVTTPETVLDSTDSASAIQLTHIFPHGQAGQAAGVCTCKGQRAYEFTPDSGNTYPYRQPMTRKVIYSTNEYDNDVANPANLHKCTWMNSPRHSQTGLPLNSVDQVAMSLSKLKRDETYFFEVKATQYDKDGFTPASVASSASQYTRRLLSVLGKSVPEQKPINRRILQTLLPMDGPITSSAIMPQGPVASANTSSDPPADAQTSAGANGVTITAESHDAAFNLEQLTTLRHEIEASHDFEWKDLIDFTNYMTILLWVGIVGFWLILFGLAVNFINQNTLAANIFNRMIYWIPQNNDGYTQVQKQLTFMDMIQLFVMCCPVLIVLNCVLILLIAIVTCGRGSMTNNASSSKSYSGSDSSLFKV